MQLLISALKPLEFCSIIVYGQTNVTTKSFTENNSHKVETIKKTHTCRNPFRINSNVRREIPGSNSGVRLSRESVKHVVAL